MKPPYGNHYSRQVQQLLNVVEKKQHQVCADPLHDPSPVQLPTVPPVLAARAPCAWNLAEPDGISASYVLLAGVVTSLVCRKGKGVLSGALLHGKNTYNLFLLALWCALQVEKLQREKQDLLHKVRGDLMCLCCNVEGPCVSSFQPPCEPVATYAYGWRASCLHTPVAWPLICASATP